MSEAKFTQGPWAYEDGMEGGAFSVYLPENGMVICSRNPYVDRAEEFSANARLISSAPELLEALDMLLSNLESDLECDGHDPSDDARVKLARAAIEKAIGSAQ